MKLLRDLKALSCWRSPTAMFPVRYMCEMRGQDSYMSCKKLCEELGNLKQATTSAGDKKEVMMGIPCNEGREMCLRRESRVTPGRRLWQMWKMALCSREPISQRASEVKATT